MANLYEQLESESQLPAVDQSSLQTIHFREFFYPINSIADDDERVRAIAFMAGLLESSAMGDFPLGEAVEHMERYCEANCVPVDSAGDQRWREWDEPTSK